MTERFIHHLRVELPAPEETAAEARVRLAEKFPRTTLRRMTHLGLMIGSTLDGLALTPDDAVVYASTFAETRALEDFLNSFPAASPLLFQTSIHPGGVQQALIGRQQPVTRLWPLASRKRLVEQALLSAVLEPADRVAVVGGEEGGTWMLQKDMAATRPFAFALSLTREAADATAKLTFDPTAAPAADDPRLESFAMALEARRSLAWGGANGSWRVDFP